MNSPSTTEVFLRRQRRRARGTLLAWAAAVTLAAVAWGLAAQRGRLAASALWQLIPMAVAAYLLGRWLRRKRGLTLRHVARAIDAHWGLNARVESTVELRAVDSPLAAAQRADADAALQHRKPLGTPAWLGGLVAAAIASLAVGWIYFGTKPPAPAATLSAPPVARAQSAPAPSPPPATEPTRASLAWVSPPKSIRARMTDELPLVARAESNRGFRAATLEVAVNGTPVVAHEVSATSLAAIAAPGRGELTLALFLDETGAKPYDIVSYRVRAETQARPDSLVVHSAVQMIEISPATPEDDTTLSPAARDLLQRIAALRRAEADVAADTQALAQVTSLAVDLERSRRVADVTRRQTTLAGDGGSVQTAAAAMRANAAVAAALTHATSAMQRAAAELTAGRTPTAGPQQAQALAALAEAERQFRAGVEAENARPPTQPASGEARPAAATATPTRATAPAGRLEQLWQRQTAINGRLAETAGDAAKMAPIASEQTSIVRDLERLIAQHGLIEPVEKIAETARTSAAAAARQFALNDVQAGREPAAQAEALLKRALDLQEQEGRDAASALLEQVRGELRNLPALDPTAQAARQEQLLRQLGAEAARQNQQGSAAAAERLANLAEKLTEASGAKRSAAENADQPADPADPSKSSPKPGSNAESPEAGGPDAPPNAMGEAGGPKTYIALLQPKPGVSGSRATGRARLVLRTDASEARLTVIVDRLGGSSTGGRLYTQTPGEAPVRLLTLPAGAISDVPLNLAAFVGLSESELLKALDEGRIGIEIDSTRFRGGELRGTFAPPGQSGGGGATPRRGGFLPGPRPQESVAMPTLSADAGAAHGRALDLSTVAAESQVALAPDHSLAQTIRQFKAAAARLNRDNDNVTSIANLKLAAEKAQWLTSDPKMAAAAKAIASGATDLAHPENVDPAALKALLQQAENLVNELERSTPPTPRDEWVRRFPPDEIDPAYRKPVQDYFEKLSREGGTR